MQAYLTTGTPPPGSSRLLLHGLLPYLLHSELHDARDQRQWHGFVERELDRALRARVGREFFLERLDTGRRRVETDMRLEAAEVHEILSLHESRNAVLHRFDSVGSRF